MIQMKLGSDRNTSTFLLGSYGGKVVESDGVEEGRVGCLLPSWRKCELFDLCDKESDAEGGVSKLLFPLVHNQSCETARKDILSCLSDSRGASFMAEGTWLMV